MTKRLVLFVEGEGDAKAVPNLVARVVNDHSLNDAIFVDQKAFRVGEFPKLAKNGFFEWKRFLRAARKRRDLGGVLLLIDGDADFLHFENCPFCAAKAAVRLAHDSREAGGGTDFSTGIVFATMEYESWLISVSDTFTEKPSHGRIRRLKERVQIPTGDLEQSPRDAKGWLKRNLVRGYKPAIDQLPLTELMDLSELRSRNIRSFARLEKAILEIGVAVRENSPIVSPLPR